MKSRNKPSLGGKRSFCRSLFALVLPIAMQNLMTALVSVSDALMLGFLDQAALSAVSLATQVQFVLNLFFAALTIGTTVLAAQYWGKRDAGAVERVLAIALRYSMPVAAAFFLAALSAPGLLMRIFTDETALVREGLTYLRIVSWSYLFMGVTQVYLCVMKNSGRTLRSTLYGSSALLLNILLNAILIFGLLGSPQMGIAGAALATTVSRAVELALVLLENLRPGVVRMRLRLIFAGTDRLRQDFHHYTMPVLANELVWGCGFTMFTVIMGHLGSDAVAANSYANIVKNLIACFCLGIGSGSGIVVGNELGRGDLERARVYGGWLVKLAVLSGALSGGLILALSPAILRHTGTLSPAAREYLRGMLYICSYYMVGKSVNSTTVGGIFCAGGDTKFGLLCDAITMWGVVVPVGTLAAFWLRLPVLWVYFLLNLDEIIKLPAVYRHYKKYQWIKNLTQ